MDQKRLFAAIAISVAILLSFQLLGPKAPLRPVQEATKTTPSTAVSAPTLNPAAPGTEPVAVAPPLSAQRDAPRLKIVAPRVEGSINLAGARLDDLVLRDYREEVTARAARRCACSSRRPIHSPTTSSMAGPRRDNLVKVPGPDVSSGRPPRPS